MKMNIGISEAGRQALSDNLSKLLASTYSLYLKTQSFHWNVQGPAFQTLHLLFEGQYTELALAVDGIAERIRSLGYPAPASYQQFTKLSILADEPGVPPAQEMIKKLMEDHESLSRLARTICPIAEKEGDQATLDLLTVRMATHEKTAWMLRSLLA